MRKQYLMVTSQQRTDIPEMFKLGCERSGVSCTRFPFPIGPEDQEALDLLRINERVLAESRFEGEEE